jgi:hypothetical protein
MKAYGGAGIKIHVFLTSALVGGEYFTPRPFYPEGTVPVTCWIGGWVDPRTSLDDMEKGKILALPGLELRSLGCPAPSQSL